MTFHNGKPVTADDLIYSFQYEVTPGSFTAGALSTVDPKTIDKVDDRTVRLHLKSPDTMLLEALWRVSVIPADFDVAHPIGSGPLGWSAWRRGPRQNWLGTTGTGMTASLIWTALLVGFHR